MKEQPPVPFPSPALEMRGVAVGSMRDQGLVVVRDIDWTVNPGQYWVVAGLQGTGKSDFMMMTGGLMAPAAGAYRLFGEPMPIFEEDRLKERLRLGLVFETGQLFNHLTVWENVALPLRYHKNLTKADALEQVRELLETLELEPWADGTPGAIGRNWQKRVGLARALTLRPEVLLVDSPLTGLDLRHSNWWLDFLARLSKGHPLAGNRPMTLVVTTADLRPWKHRACCFAVIREQRFGILGDWDKLQAEATGLVTELLMAEAKEEA